MTLFYILHRQILENSSKNSTFIFISFATKPSQNVSAQGIVIPEMFSWDFEKVDKILVF